MAELKVNKDDLVRLEYTGTLSDGSVFDTSKDRAPLVFKAGAGEVIPGFDKAVMGMKVNESKKFTIISKEAYGPIRAELVREFPRNQLPEKPEPKEGMMLMMQAPQGMQIPAKITKVSKDKVTIDINHPLAGKDLTFEIKILAINDPEDEKCDDNCGEECSGCGDHCGCGH